MPTWHFSKPRIPVRAGVLSIAALAVPVAATQWAPEAYASPLVWLVALIPAFLLAYYRGWGGVSTALAAAMATLATSNVVLIWRGETVDDVLLLVVISVYITICLAVGWLSEALHASRERAELVALTDELTSLPNRRHVRMFLERQLAAPRRSSLSVVLFDLDGFKRYNDDYGHPAGDVMLCTFAEVLSRLVPAGSMPARYGGEEFLAVLVDFDEVRACAFADRVRAALRAAQVLEMPLTVSAGVAAGGVGVAHGNELIVAADRALYRAKQDGRDRVCGASTTMAAVSQESA
jgi:diguanylate cyclase (GGDEF)-like protein